MKPTDTRCNFCRERSRVGALNQRTQVSNPAFFTAMGNSLNFSEPQFPNKGGLGQQAHCEA